VRRALTMLSIASVALGLAACVGQTDPATNVTNVSARLNAHGYTNDGPATWWWEYDTVKAELGTANDTEVCGSGTGPKEPDARCGPASGGSQQNQIPVNVVVTGLTPSTTYFFRACGQDTNDPSPSCGSTHSFTTLAGTSYAFDRKWGSLGTGNGQFDHPVGVATDSTGNVYVADEGNDRIQKFNSTGGFITKWGTGGTGNGQFNAPEAVAVHSGSVYVADSGNNRIQKFNTSGGFVTKWGSLGAGDGQFNIPTGVATDSAGNVYVADEDNNRIQKFDSSGAFITTWGTAGSGNGQFDTPAGVATDSAGDVYVADEGNNRIQKFDPSGAFITTWGTSGSGNGQFDAPEGVAVDSAGGVFVADVGNNRIQKFNSSGGFITTFGAPGSDDGEFLALQDLGTDPFGNVYAVDAVPDPALGLASVDMGNNIEKFKPVQPQPTSSR
jgi:DNA-binding beta-propeller fold protein YncE